MNKIIIAVVAVLILAGAGYYFYRHNQAQAPSIETQSSQSQLQTSPTPQPSPNTQTQTNVNGGTGPDYTPPQSATGGETAAPNVQVTEVDFDGSQFTPNTVNIKVNDWVFFKNKSTTDFWVASDPHPTHTDYPGFDAKQPIAPGGEYKFQFTKVGSWGYHDHLDPSIGGTVVVSQ